MNEVRTGANGHVNGAKSTARTRKSQPKRCLKLGEIVIPSGSRKSMLVHLALELWRRDRLDLKRLPHARARGRIRTQAQALKALTRASAADLEPLVEAALGDDGERVRVEGAVRENRERALLERLGVEYDPGDEFFISVGSNGGDGERKPLRFLDMTPAMLGLAAVVMALRYLALGMSDRELYVMAGLGYAAFMLMRTFSYKLRRPRNAPPPELG